MLYSVPTERFFRCGHNFDAKVSISRLSCEEQIDENRQGWRENRLAYHDGTY
jgi:hypothetical protein